MTDKEYEVMNETMDGMMDSLREDFINGFLDDCPEGMDPEEYLKEHEEEIEGCIQAWIEDHWRC